MAIGIHVLLAFDFEITALLCSVYTLLKRKLGPRKALANHDLPRFLQASATRYFGDCHGHLHFFIGLNGRAILFLEQYIQDGDLRLLARSGSSNKFLTWMFSYLHFSFLFLLM
jgi:hypothetical protein